MAIHELRPMRPESGPMQLLREENRRTKLPSRMNARSIFPVPRRLQLNIINPLIGRNQTARSSASRVRTIPEPIATVASKVCAHSLLRRRLPAHKPPSIHHRPRPAVVGMQGAAVAGTQEAEAVAAAVDITRSNPRKELNL